MILMLKAVMRTITLTPTLKSIELELGIKKNYTPLLHSFTTIVKNSKVKTSRKNGKSTKL